MNGTSPLQFTHHGLYRASQVRQPLTQGRVGAWRREASEETRRLLARLDAAATRYHPSGLLPGGGASDSCWDLHDASDRHPEVSHAMAKHDAKPKMPFWRLPSRAYGGLPGLFLGDPELESE